MIENRKKNDSIDRHVLAAIRGGATRAASIRKALSGTLEGRGIRPKAWRSRENLMVQMRDIDRSLQRLRKRGLISYCCPDWEVRP